MNVAYLTIEDISSGLFKTQVLDILEEICNHDNSIQFDVLIINRPWHLFKHKFFLEKYRKDYKFRNINFIYIPLLPPLRNSLKYFLFSYFVTKWLQIIYQFFLKFRKYDILHCRSYWPTVTVLNTQAPIIFDMRSLWVLENISSGEIRLNSKSHFYWKKNEINCIEGSSVSTCVSQSMLEYVRNISISSKSELIPISVNADLFGFDSHNRDINRSILKWEDNIVFVYSGSLGQSGININAVVSLINKIIKVNDCFRVLIVTSEKFSHFKSIMDNFNIDVNKYKIVNPNLNEISSWLDAADIGIHALPKQLDSSTRLGTKVVEYWINGLPVIVNQNVGAAADYIKRNGIGYVIDDSFEDEIILKNIKQILCLKRTEISDFAKKEFSSKFISGKYLNLYRQILKK